MQKKLYEVIEGDNILNITESKSEAIVQDFLYEDDYIMLVAEEKAGKTILSQQLACNLTTGTPFLDMLEIHKPVNVWYFATEGKTEDLKDRFMRMSHKIKLDTSRLKLIPSFFWFNSKDGILALNEILTTYETQKPKVIIIDALYRALKGDLTKSEDVNEFHHIIGRFARECGAAVMLVHHMTKASRREDGTYYDRSDKDTYGSAFLKAAVDTCFWLDNSKNSKNEKFLKCQTQRSGNVIPVIRLKLNQPDPLYFEAMDIHMEEETKLIELLKTNSEPMDAATIENKLQVKRTTLYKVLRDLYEKGTITKSKGKRKFFSLNTR